VVCEITQMMIIKRSPMPSLKILRENRLDLDGAVLPASASSSFLASGLRTRPYTLSAETSQGDAGHSHWSIPIRRQVARKLMPGRTAQFGRRLGLTVEFLRPDHV